MKNMIMSPYDEEDYLPEDETEGSFDDNYDHDWDYFIWDYDDTWH